MKIIIYFYIYPNALLWSPGQTFLTGLRGTGRSTK